MTTATVDTTMDNTRRRRQPHPISVDSGTNDATINDKSLLQKKKKKKRRRKDDLPFHILFLQVGACLLLVCGATWTAWKWTRPTVTEYVEEYDDDDSQNYEIPEEELVEPTPPPLPVWELGNASRYDAFALSERYKRNDKFWKLAQEMRDEFQDIYGGENAARALLERGLVTFGRVEAENDLPLDLVHTACRIRQAQTEERPFSFTFGGYSVTVGRGNYFHQSFPFVMERLLRPLFSALGMDLSVQNAALGGCPAFPYGWCMSNFWGDHSDVVSWDYSMNEAGGVSEGLEAYVRHAMTLSRNPKLIVKDTHLAPDRNELLRHYVEQGALHDPLVLHTEPAARPFLDRRERDRPIGFQEWRKFGGPPDGPGQALHHPAVKEHEFIGWMLAMHFLSALEILAANPSFNLTCSAPAKEPVLPPPVNNVTTHEWSSVLFGQQNAEQNSWTMRPVHCRTSFEPIVQGNLTSIVVSGGVGEDIGIMLPKSHMFYNKGWVLDLSEEEKTARHKLDKYGGLGFVDSKKAYYGIYSSGNLRLHLPYESSTAASTGPNVGDPARDWFRTIVVCEVNEKRSMGACRTEKDVSYAVGGVNATKPLMIDSPGTLYLGKKICVSVGIPEGATITSEKPKTKGRMSVNATVGVSLEIRVRNPHIMAIANACSVSHVVWEEKSPPRSAATKS